MKFLDTERYYTEAIDAILSQFGKKFDWNLKMQIMGLQHIPMCEKIVEFHSLPIPWEEFSREMRERTKVLMQNPNLMAGNLQRFLFIFQRH